MTHREAIMTAYQEMGMGAEELKAMSETNASMEQHPEYGNYLKDLNKSIIPPKTERNVIEAIKSSATVK